MAAKHSERSHALLSASGATRWLACPPSARLEENIPDQKKLASDEGTLAHELAELLLKYKLGRIATRFYKEDLAAIKANELYSKEMYDHCSDFAIFVLEIYYELQKKCNDEVQLLIERKTDLTTFIPEGFGTVDITIACSLICVVIDFKYGKGVEVSAVENSQLKVYALGVAEDYDFVYDFKEIELIIFQPRLHNTSRFKLTYDDLKKWAKKILIPGAKKAWDGKGEFAPGKHCQFCRAHAQCKAAADYNNELAAYVFLKPQLLRPHEMAFILERAPIFKNWLGAVTDHVLREALQGKTPPGYKLVAGRSKRIYTDPDAIIKTLDRLGYFGDEIMEPEKLLGVTKLEKVIGSKDFNKFLNEFVDKAPGKPTLVPNNDPRKPLDPADAARIVFDVGSSDDDEADEE